MPFKAAGDAARHRKLRHASCLLSQTSSSAALDKRQQTNCPMAKRASPLQPHALRVVPAPLCRVARHSNPAGGCTSEIVCLSISADVCFCRNSHHNHRSSRGELRDPHHRGAAIDESTERDRALCSVGARPCNPHLQRRQQPLRRHKFHCLDPHLASSRNSQPSQAPTLRQMYLRSADTQNVIGEACRGEEASKQAKSRRQKAMGQRAKAVARSTCAAKAQIGARHHYFLRENFALQS